MVIQKADVLLQGPLIGTRESPDERVGEQYPAPYIVGRGGTDHLADRRFDQLLPGAGAHGATSA
ncbi:Uncharacterised protein [Mycobacteroides abscessus]|nr:Uncharacterised protein [Mycobacteroides abscessus]CQA12509.1 Uncharacterised protein [Mycobacteroides abscessus]SHV94086.1 Uncharacterised protein [Mycobacteroides abscessus subsp. abscessus]